MKILLSPAKTLDFTRKINTVNHSEALFQKESNALALRMKKYDTIALGQIMKMSETLAELTYMRFAQWDNDDVEMKQAGAAFKGEAYNGLDLPSLTKDELDIAQDRLRILSGMYGILKPCDIIKPYRLEMGSKLKPSLYDYWSEKVTKSINDEEQETIINLCSQEYYKVIDKKSLNARVINCDFKEYDNGKLRTKVVYMKKARGLMSRYIIQHDITDPEQMKAFNEERYQFDEELSTDLNYVFTR